MRCIWRVPQHEIMKRGRSRSRMQDAEEHEDEYQQCVIEDGSGEDLMVKK